MGVNTFGLKIPISPETAMIVADSSYDKLFKLLSSLDPHIRREAAVDWRTNYKKWLGTKDKAAAKQAEEEYFKRWTK